MSDNATHQKDLHALMISQMKDIAVIFSSIKTEHQAAAYFDRLKRRFTQLTRITSILFREAAFQHIINRHQLNRLQSQI